MNENIDWNGVSNTRGSGLQFCLIFFTKFCQKTLLYTSYENVCEHMIFHNNKA